SGAISVGSSPIGGDTDVGGWAFAAAAVNRHARPARYPMRMVGFLRNVRRVRPVRKSLNLRTVSDGRRREVERKRPGHAVVAVMSIWGGPRLRGTGLQNCDSRGIQVSKP